MLSIGRKTIIASPKKAKKTQKKDSDGRKNYENLAKKVPPEPERCKTMQDDGLEIISNRDEGRKNDPLVNNWAVHDIVIVPCQAA